MHHGRSNMQECNENSSGAKFDFLLYHHFFGHHLDDGLKETPTVYNGTIFFKNSYRYLDSKTLHLRFFLISKSLNKHKWGPIISVYKSECSARDVGHLLVLARFPIVWVCGHKDDYCAKQSPSLWWPNSCFLSANSWLSNVLPPHLLKKTSPHLENEPSVFDLLRRSGEFPSSPPELSLLFYNWPEPRDRPSQRFLGGHVWEFFFDVLASPMTGERSGEEKKKSRTPFTPSLILPEPGCGRQREERKESRMKKKGWKRSYTVSSSSKDRAGISHWEKWADGDGGENGANAVILRIPERSGHHWPQSVIWSCGVLYLPRLCLISSIFFYHFHGHSRRSFQKLLSSNFLDASILLQPNVTTAPFLVPRIFQ